MWLRELWIRYLRKLALMHIDAWCSIGVGQPERAARRRALNIWILNIEGMETKRQFRYCGYNYVMLSSLHLLRFGFVYAKFHPSLFRQCHKTLKGYSLLLPFLTLPSTQQKGSVNLLQGGFGSPLSLIPTIASISVVNLPSWVNPLPVLLLWPKVPRPRQNNNHPP